MDTTHGFSGGPVYTTVDGKPDKLIGIWKGGRYSQKKKLDNEAMHTHCKPRKPHNNLLEDNEQVVKYEEECTVRNIATSSA